LKRGRSSTATGGLQHSSAGHLEARKSESPSRIGEEGLFIDGTKSKSPGILVNL
jgi:hypothetical protein